METTTYSGTLLLINCGQCGVPFGMDEQFHGERKRDHRTWYCPNGHQRHYPAKNEAEQAREEAARARQTASFWEQRAASERREKEAARRKAAAARGVVTRIKRRVGRGVCPCCNRTFADLGRHMAGQHPDFATVEE